MDCRGLVEHADSNPGLELSAVLTNFQARPMLQFTEQALSSRVLTWGFSDFSVYHSYLEACSIPKVPVQ
jgi:hypothetical protein